MSRLKLDRAYRKMILLADTQKTITDTDLQAIAQELGAEAAHASEPANKGEAAKKPAKRPADIPSAAHLLETGYGHGV